MGELHNFIQLDIKDNDRERDKIYTKTKLYNLESRSNFNSYNEFVGCFNTGINKRRMLESVYGSDTKRILNDQGKIYIWSSSFRFVVILPRNVWIFELLQKLTNFVNK